MACSVKKIDILAVAKEKLCIATIFIRGIKHLEIVIDIKYQYYQTIFRYKKAFLRFGCFCSNATVHEREMSPPSLHQRRGC